MSRHGRRELHELPENSLAVRLAKARAEREAERRAQDLLDASLMTGFVRSGPSIAEDAPAPPAGVDATGGPEAPRANARDRRAPRRSIREVSGPAEPSSGQPATEAPTSQARELGEPATCHSENGAAAIAPRETGEPCPEIPMPPPVDRPGEPANVAGLPETAPPLPEGGAWPVSSGEPGAPSSGEPTGISGDEAAVPPSDEPVTPPSGEPAIPPSGEAAASAPAAAPGVRAAAFALTPETLPLLHELEQVRAEAESLRAQVRAAHDELRAARRRAEKDKDDLSRFAAGDVIMKIIPVVDDLERALAHVPHALDAEPWVKGVLMIGQALLAVLEGQGVERIDPRGQPFDPHRHEAVTQMSSDELPEDTITEVYRPGYSLHGRILRPAQVQVAVRKDS